MLLNRHSGVHALVAICLVTVLSACSSTKPRDEAKRFIPAVSVDAMQPEPAVVAPVAVETDLAPTQPVMAELEPTPTEAQEQALAEQVISEERSVFFDLAKNDVKPEYNKLLNSVRVEIDANKIGAVRIEGNTDVRGSRAYNLALGQRRADAVRDALVTIGVPRGLIKTVSYGKERPLSTNTDEASHALNRRADILYQGEY